METIGFLELNSIAKGIEAADAMLKAAEVRLITARPSCPGKYHVLVTGEVAAVQSSVEAGMETASANVLDQVVIPRVHPQVIAAIGLSTVPEQSNAVGILEYFSVTASLYGADAAVKAADVTLLEVRLGTGIGGKSFVVMTGNVSAVTEGVEAGAASAGDSGLLVSRVVIPSPHPELFESLY
ncbi:MAG: BMC domain-containing protein [Oscillibacter sp.]|nr:BMC domain-containing protein [Oscillibacter sp.]MCI9375347.1 BMC domain-containing protein [Oscillibacter sp.]